MKLTSHIHHSLLSKGIDRDAADVQTCLRNLEGKLWISQAKRIQD